MNLENGKWNLHQLKENILAVPTMLILSAAF